MIAHSVCDKEMVVLKEVIIKDLPLGVLNILTLHVATSLVQKRAGGQFILTDELIEQVIDTSWEAIRA